MRIGGTEVEANNSVELHGLFDLVIAVEERLTAPEAAMSDPVLRFENHADGA